MNNEAENETQNNDASLPWGIVVKSGTDTQI